MLCLPWTVGSTVKEKTSMVLWGAVKSVKFVDVRLDFWGGLE